MVEKQGAVFDVEVIRKDFPILQTSVNGKPLVFLDNAASAQKPKAVIESLDHYYQAQHANIHRGVHYLSQVATEAYEDARKVVAGYIGAERSAEVIFTRGTTEAINLVAQTWGMANLTEGDEVLLTEMEHHANIVPWQLLAERLGFVIKVIKVTDQGELDLNSFAELLTEKTKLLGLCFASNSLGTINPVETLIKMAQEKGAKVLIDGAQALPHFPVNVAELGCDFFVFSAHKVFGPTGIGILYGKEAILNSMPPYQGGGDMIERVSFAGTTYRKAPERFEAGTPHISGAIAFAEALKYLEKLGHHDMLQHEQSLLEYGTQKISEIPGIRIYGQSEAKVPVISFMVDGAHPQDLGTMLDMDGIAIRTGHHCTMPLWQRFGIEGTCRASFAFYNTHAEVDIFVESLVKAKKTLT